MASPGDPSAQGICLGLGKRIERGIAAEQEGVHTAVARRLIGKVGPRRLSDLHGRGLTAGAAGEGGGSGEEAARLVRQP